MKKTAGLQKEDGLKVYRFISIVFAVLSIINIGAVIVTFRSTGNNLFYAEEALSHISKIEQYLQTTNEEVLNIVINKNDPTAVTAGVANIESEFKLLQEEAETFRGIDISRIDNTIKSDFDSAMVSVASYRSALSKIQNYSAFEIENYYRSNIEPVRVMASNDMRNVVEKQSSSTNTFFHKIAHEFMFLLLFMAFTMAVGLNSINYMKRKAKKANFEIEVNKQSARANAHKASHFREKAMEMAYTNVLTDLKNRYALEKDLDERLKTENIILAFFTYDDFHEMTTSYGRDFGDDFLIGMSDLIKDTYSEQFEIYHTSSNEFCFVVKGSVTKEQADAMFTQVIQTLSTPIEITKLKISLNVSGCVYYYSCSERLNTNALFVKIDKVMKKMRMRNEHRVMKINSVYTI
ncbi:MAG TPA: hypothetical protein DCO72_11185 [Ruminococcus sp.]|nr:hypothetical protein [Ruminococcus sp.]